MGGPVSLAKCQVFGGTTQQKNTLEPIWKMEKTAQDEKKADKDVAVNGDAILALTKERGQAMREHMQARLEMLRMELAKGQVELQKVESQRTYLHETLLRISGAIQLLEELLAEEQSAEQNATAGADKAQLATPLSDGSDSRRT